MLCVVTVAFTATIRLLCKHLKSCKESLSLLDVEGSLDQRRFEPPLHAVIA